MNQVSERAKRGGSRAESGFRQEQHTARRKLEDVGVRCHLMDLIFCIRSEARSSAESNGQVLTEGLRAEVARGRGRRGVRDWRVAEINTG